MKLNSILLFWFFIAVCCFCGKEKQIIPKEEEPVKTEEGRINVVSTLSPEKTISMENPQVCRYLDEVQYLNGFNGSSVTKYAVESGYRMDFPKSFYLSLPNNRGESLTVRIRSIRGDYPHRFTDTIKSDVKNYEITNLIPGNLYCYEVTTSDNTQLLSDSLFASGQVRMIYSENALNVRDIGGWRTSDGKRVRYGRIYRGSAYSRGFSKRDAAVIINQLGVNVEIDLRSEAELRLDDDNPNNDLNYSLFGSGVSYFHYPMPLKDFINEDKIYVEVFRTILSSLRNGGVIYIHCAGGADRTGTIVLMLEALLGVCDSEMAKDYEITSFAPLYYDKNNFRTCDRCTNTFNHFIDVSGKSGSTNEIATNYMLSLGVTKSEIDLFKSIMLKP